MIYSGIASGGSRATGLLLSLAIIPAILAAVGEVQFGIWTSTSSIFASLAFADLGVGNGLISSLAAACGKRDADQARKLVSTAAVLLAGIGGTILVVFVPLACLYDLGTLLHLPQGPSPGTLSQVILIVGTGFALSLPATLAARIRLAQQQAYINAAWEVVGQIGVLLAVIWTIHSRLSLPWIIAGTVFPALFASLAHCWSLLRRDWKSSDGPCHPVRPNKGVAARLLHIGVQYSTMQLAGIALVAVDGFLAAQSLSFAASAEIAVSQRIFSIPPILAGLFLLPLWPAYAEAAATGDRKFIVRTFRLSLFASLILAAIVLLIGTYWSEAIFTAWLGATSRALPSSQLIAANACWATISIIGGPIAMLLNGLGKVRFQVITSLALVVVALSLKYVFIHVYGLPGLIWAAVAAQAICVTLPCTWYARQLLLRDTTNLAGKAI